MNKNIRTRTECKLNTVEKPINTFPVHKEANVFNLYTIEDMDGLVASIKKYGLLQPALLWWDKNKKEWILVDGRHRMEACNRLKIKLDVYKLKKSIKEEDLPEVVLSTQLLKRGLDKIVANCEVVTYLEKGRNTIEALISEYRILDKNMIRNLRVIKRVNPLWFSTLRNGNHVKLSDGTFTRALRALAEKCREAERLSREISIADEDLTNVEAREKQEQAIAFAEMEPVVDMVIFTIDKKDKKYYAFTRLMSQKCKQQQAIFGTTKEDQRIKLLEEELNLSQKESDRYKSELKLLELYVSNLESTNNDIMQMLPRNAKTAKKMRKWKS